MMKIVATTIITIIIRINLMSVKCQKLAGMIRVFVVVAKNLRNAALIRGLRIYFLNH
jgi:hypothetical protein